MDSKLTEAIWFVVIVLWLGGMMYYAKDSNETLKDIRTVTSEQRDATWCLVAPDNSCE